MPQANADYYKILQVDPSVDPEILTVAFKRLARKYHPDPNGIMIVVTYCLIDV